MEVIWQNATTYGPTGLLALFIVAILWGRLVTRRTMIDLIESKDAIIESKQAMIDTLTSERNELRRVNDAKNETIATAVRQSAEMMELSRLAAHVMDSLPKGGGDNVRTIEAPRGAHSANDT